MVKARFSQRDVSRAILAAKEAGLPIGAITIFGDGTIRVDTAAVPQSPDAELDDWFLEHEAQEQIRDATAEAALRDAGSRLSPGNLASLFGAQAEVSNRKAAKFLGMTPLMLDDAVRFRHIERTKAGGEARYTQAAISSAIWPPPKTSKKRGPRDHG